MSNQPQDVDNETEQLEEGKAPETVSISFSKSNTNLRDEGDAVSIEVSTNEFTAAVREVVENTELDIEDIPRDGIGTRRREGSISGMRKAFKQDRNWRAVYPKPPLGYEFDSAGWITVNSDEIEMVRELFTIFLNAPIFPAFTTTADEFNEQYPNHEQTPFRYQKVKRLLQKSVYIGSPSTEITDTESDTSDEVVVDDPDLQIIDDSVFEDAQEKLENIANIGEEVDEIRDLEWLISEYGTDAVLKVMDDTIVGADGEVALQCPDCAGTDMRPYSHSQRKYLDDGVCVSKYNCWDCNRWRAIPRQAELFELMKLDAQ